MPTIPTSVPTTQCGNHLCGCAPGRVPSTAPGTRAVLTSLRHSRDIKDTPGNDARTSSSSQTNGPFDGQQTPSGRAPATGTFARVTNKYLEQHLLASGSAELSFFLKDTGNVIAWSGHRFRRRVASLSPGRQKRGERAWLSCQLCR